MPASFFVYAGCGERDSPDGYGGTSSAFIPPNAPRRAPPAYGAAGGHAIQTIPFTAAVYVNLIRNDWQSVPSEMIAYAPQDILPTLPVPVLLGMESEVPASRLPRYPLLQVLLEAVSVADSTILLSCPRIPSF